VEAGRDVARSRCGHEFHDNCLARQKLHALSENQMAFPCCVCRYPITTDEAIIPGKFHYEPWTREQQDNDNAYRQAVRMDGYLQTVGAMMGLGLPVSREARQQYDNQTQRNEENAQTHDHVVKRRVQRIQNMNSTIPERRRNQFQQRAQELGLKTTPTNTLYTKRAKDETPTTDCMLLKLRYHNFSDFLWVSNLDAIVDIGIAWLSVALGHVIPGLDFETPFIRLGPVQMRWERRVPDIGLKNGDSLTVIEAERDSEEEDM
jgi:hypothetical protein